MDYKPTRVNCHYTKEANPDLSVLRREVAAAWEKAVSLGYNPTDIFYEVVSGANLSYINDMLEGQNK